jgi:chromosome segregation ATPase
MKRLHTYILALSALLVILTACDNRAEQEASLNEELEALQAQVSSFESQVEAQTSELETARQRVSELEAQLAEQEPQIARVEQLRQQLAARTSQLQQAQTRIRNLEQRRELTLESQLEEIDRLMERLRTQRSELVQRLEAVGVTPAESNAASEEEPASEQ